MTYSQFVDYLSTIKGCQFVNLITRTDAEMNKGRGKNTNPYWGRVEKVAFGVMQFNYSYVNAVQNWVDKVGNEEEFVGESLEWGRWHLYKKVITHRGNYYLRTYPTRNDARRVYYLLDGIPVTPQEFAKIKPWLKETPVSTKQLEAGLEEKEQVKPKNYKFSSVVAITINGTRIQIIPD